jgi:hypothetical protein
MGALRAFRWAEPAAEVFVRGLQRLDGRPFLTAVLNNTAEILQMGAPSGYPQPAVRGLYEGTEWQAAVLAAAGAVVAETAATLRVLVSRARRDGPAAELHREVVPFFLAYFRVAAWLFKDKFRDIGDLIGGIVDAAFGTLAAAFDVPEIIEAVLKALLKLAAHDNERMARDPASVWVPLSIILAPDFSPLDRSWIPALAALIRYHQLLAMARPEPFYATFEAAIGQFMDPAPILEVFRDGLPKVSPDSSTPVITLAFAQAYAQLHAHAVGFGWDG